MEAIFTIENGDKLPYQIVSDGVFGLYEVKTSKGKVPVELGGKYSKALDAKRVVEAYVNAEAAVNEVKKRRKAVKVGKEKWAKKKQAEAVTDGET